MMMPGTCWNLGEGREAAPALRAEGGRHRRPPDARQGPAERARTAPPPGVRPPPPTGGCRREHARRDGLVERAACRERPSSTHPPAHPSGSGCLSPT